MELMMPQRYKKNAYSLSFFSEQANKFSKMWIRTTLCVYELGIILHYQP